MSILEHTEYSFKAICNASTRIVQPGSARNFLNLSIGQLTAPKTLALVWEQVRVDDL